MKKYNCNNTLEYVHEFTRMCRTFSECSGCPLAGLHCELYEIIPEHIKRVQIWSDAHPEITLTDKQVEVLKALNTLGFDYLAQDSNGKIWAYAERPEKSMVEWRYENSGFVKLNSLRADVFNVVSPLVNWSDKEPLNIALALEQAEVHP